MNIDDLHLLYAYNEWANQRLLATAAALTPAQLRAPAVPDPGYGTLFGSLLHIYDSEYSWRLLLQQGKWSTGMHPDDFASLDALAQRWQVEAAAMRAYLGELSDEDLTGVVRYTTGEGVQRERVLWHCLLHVVNHGTYHRGEAAALLTGLGHSPGELDFTFFLLE